MKTESIHLNVDARGWVFEPVTSDDLPRQQNVHLVLNFPGSVRGNHHHPRGSEICVVQGPCLVRVRENGILNDVVVEATTWMRFVFPPGLAHAILNTGTLATFLLSFNTVPFDPSDPDVVRDILIPHE